MGDAGFPTITVKTSPNKDRHWAIMASSACAFLFALLVLLGIMQYRWIAELRQAERRQLEQSLKATADQFADDFASELLRVITAFQLEYRSPADSLPRQLKDAYEQWIGSAPHPMLIQEIFVVASADNPFRASQFDVNSGTLGEIEWLDILDPLQRLRATSPHSPPTSSGMIYPSTSPVLFLETVPALAVPFLMTDSPDVSRRHIGGKREQTDIVGWSVVRLDRNLIVEQMLPALFKAHFAVSDPPPYRVAVASADESRRIVYQSEPMSLEDLNTADLVLNLIKKTGGQLETTGPQTVRILAPDSPQWQLFVKHRLGSLDVVAENLRRRNLIIGAGILIALGCSVLLILVVAGRARALGQIQLEFAAAISHELRTPLAVIRAASYNLEEGVVEDASDVRRYAGLLADAGRRLSKMVDQILLLAETQSRRNDTPLKSINVGDAIENALDGISSVLLPGLCPIERQIPQKLPLIAADPFLVSHCLQNLIINAAKYGEVSGQKPIRIAVLVRSDKGEVQIRVIDQGPGINQADLPNIFKPFYRGKQSHLHPAGNGLGLTLVQRLMERQRGAVSVQTGPYSGTIFTLHFPIAST